MPRGEHEVALVIVLILSVVVDDPPVRTQEDDGRRRTGMSTRLDSFRSFALARSLALDRLKPCVPLLTELLHAWWFIRYIQVLVFRTAVQTLMG